MTANPLADARTTLAGLLNTTDLPGYSSPPTDEDLTYPCVYVVPGDPYLSWDSEDGFLPAGQVHARFEAVLILADGASLEDAQALDDQILGLVDRISATGDYLVLQVRQPGQVTLNETDHLAVAIETRTTVDLRT